MRRAAAGDRFVVLLLEILAEGARLVALVLHVLEHHEERERTHVARHAGDFDVTAGFLALAGPGGKELNGRREAHAVFLRERLFRELLAVEILHLARAPEIELQHDEMFLDVGRDLGLREIHEVSFLAIGAALLLPEDHEALAALRCFLEVLPEVEEAVEEPWLHVEAVLAERRLLRRLGRARPRPRCRDGEKNESNSQRPHGQSPSWVPRRRGLDGAAGTPY